MSELASYQPAAWALREVGANSPVSLVFAWRSTRDSASDMDMSSEDDDAPPSRKPKRGGDDEDEDDMLFPLEGKYKDDADRR